MDESAALDTTAARAAETADRDRVLWSDADREWARRAAAAIVGERASAEEFLGRRAQPVLERIGTRQPAVTRTVRGILWRPWVGVVTADAVDEHAEPERAERVDRFLPGWRSRRDELNRAPLADEEWELVGEWVRLTWHHSTTFGPGRVLPERIEP